MNEPFDSVPQDATVYPWTVRAEVTRLTAWGVAGTGSDPEQAQRIGESIRRTVEELGIESKKTKSAIVTVSVGVATATGRDELLPDQLVRRADRALYNAKESGRNRTEVAA